RRGKEDPHAFSGLLARMHVPVQSVRQPEHDVRVVVAHPSPILAEALGRLLDDLGTNVVATACDPEALLSRLVDGPLDVLVLDAGFHPASGPLVTLERVRAAAPGLRVVVLAD